MNLTQGFLRKNVPFTVAFPWVLLFLLSPVWLLYVYKTLCIVTAVIQSLIAPGSVALRAVQNDFIVFWPASHIMITNQVAKIYDPVWFSAWRAVHLAVGVSSYLQYPYPPPALLTLLPLVLCGYFGGFLVWTANIVLPGIALLNWAGVSRRVIVTGLLSSAGVYTVWLGQFGILTGAIFIASLLYIGRNRNRAGVLLGILIIKPQAGLLGPIALLARGQYRSLGIAILVILGLSLTVTVCFGTAIWPSFVTLALPQAHRILDAPFPTTYENSGASVFWMMRSFGATVSFACTLQIISAAISSAWCWIAWRRPQGDRLGLIALTSALTLLVTPYGYTDDMWGFTLMVGWLAWDRRRLELADVLMWMWPELCPIIATLTHMELTPLILLLGAIRAWKRLNGIGTTAPACYPVPL